MQDTFAKLIHRIRDMTRDANITIKSKKTIKLTGRLSPYTHATETEFSIHAERRAVRQQMVLTFAEQFILDITVPRSSHE